MTVYPVNLRFTYYVESREKRSFYSVKVRLKGVHSRKVTKISKLIVDTILFWS